MPLHRKDPYDKCLLLHSISSLFLLAAWGIYGLSSTWNGKQQIPCPGCLMLGICIIRMMSRVTTHWLVMSISQLFWVQCDVNAPPEFLYWSWNELNTDILCSISTYGRLRSACFLTITRTPWGLPEDNSKTHQITPRSFNGLLTTRNILSYSYRMVQPWFSLMLYLPLVAHKAACHNFSDAFQKSVKIW